jgi:hypothetical protein
MRWQVLSQTSKKERKIGILLALEVEQGSETPETREHGVVVDP